MLNKIAENIISKFFLPTLMLFRTDNGIIIIDNYFDDEKSTSTQVFELEDGFGEINYQNLINIHYKIDEFFGIYASKHNKINIAHKLEHGSNYNCNKKECTICKEKEEIIME